MAIQHTIRKDGKGNTVSVNLTAIKAIRHHCLVCYGFSSFEVKDCSSPLCPLYPFRLGTIPGKKSNNPSGAGSPFLKFSVPEQVKSANKRQSAIKP